MNLDVQQQIHWLAAAMGCAARGLRSRARSALHGDVRRAGGAAARVVRGAGPRLRAGANQSTAARPLPRSTRDRGGHRSGDAGHRTGCDRHDRRPPALDPSRSGVARLAGGAGRNADGRGAQHHRAALAAAGTVGPASTATSATCCAPAASSSTATTWTSIRRRRAWRACACVSARSSGPTPRSPRGIETAEQWWDALAAEPALAPLLAERTRRFAGKQHQDTPPGFDVHVAALRDAGFREVDTIWQALANRVVLAVR
jgi:hypothetical protein